MIDTRHASCTCINGRGCKHWKHWNTCIDVIILFVAVGVSLISIMLDTIVISAFVVLRPIPWYGLVLLN